MAIEQGSNLLEENCCEVLFQQGPNDTGLVGTKDLALENVVSSRERFFNEGNQGCHTLSFTFRRRGPSPCGVTSLERQL